ncbi:Reverse transcriptase domain [Cinara cedri]|uniref:Reverse transcriptase domain n=1 Tax=Cinara cedri TaxID=506608 RepID=A0A5E4NCK5_9HEMI|nr:Reverse transcriptase domain [Cinara cedri]
MIDGAFRRKNTPVYVAKIVRSYLSGRTLRSNGVTTTLRCGVLQGSVLGSLLWNILYDDLLEVDPGGNVAGVSSVSLVAFADDLAVVATGHDTRTLEDVGNHALTGVAEWMKENGLALSTEKSEAVILTSKRGYAPPAFAIDGVPIRTEEAIKYLGVQLHKTLGFKAHLQAAAARAQKTAMALWQIMPNVGGAQQRKRRLLVSVVDSVALYAPPVWAGAMVFELNIADGVHAGRTRHRGHDPRSPVGGGEVAAARKAHGAEKRDKGRRGPGGSVQEVAGGVAANGEGPVDQEGDRRRPAVDLQRLGIGKAPDASCADCQAAVDDAEHAFFRSVVERRKLEIDIGGDLAPETVVGAML